MKLGALPPLASQILIAVNAPPRLVAHASLVHDCAARLIEQLAQDRLICDMSTEHVCIGAALHDIGKAIVNQELSRSGTTHEQIGYDLLVARGLPHELARFCITHGDSVSLDELDAEDLLVRLSDKLWKGTRNVDTELELARRITKCCGTELWSAFVVISRACDELASDSDTRLAWHASFATNPE